MTHTTHVVYLHGFSSSPASSKAAYYAQRLNDYDATFTAPDLNVPSFEYLSMTAQIARTAETVADLPPGPVYLIGSSMGGMCAVQFLARHRDGAAARVDGAVLMAPGLDFRLSRVREIGEAGLDHWRETGWRTVDHYAYGPGQRVHYGLVEDLAQYDAYAVHLDTPILIFHGINDETVDYRVSQRFAEGRPNVSLHLLDSDHSLQNQLDAMWALMRLFFKL